MNSVHFSLRTFAFNLYFDCMSRPLKEQVDVYDALASPIRREIVALLKRGERPAGSLAEYFKVTQPSLSRHLQVMREAGLVRQRQKGRQRIYTLNITALREVERWVKLQLK